MGWIERHLPARGCDWVQTSCIELVRTAGGAFGEKVIKSAPKAETLKRMFRLALRIDILRADGVKQKQAPSSSKKGHYLLRIRHVNSGTTVDSTARIEPIWKQSFVIGPVEFQDSVQFSLIWRPQASRIVQLCCRQVLGIISLPVSGISAEESNIKPLKFQNLGGASLLAHIRLWREPKRAYISHVIVILTLLKEPVRLINKLSWDSIWTPQETALLQAHGLGLTRAATLTARLHALSIAASKIPPNFLLVFETLSKLRLMPVNPHEEKVIDLCRRFNKGILEYLKDRKSPVRCLTAYDQTQLVGMLGCCALIEDFDLVLSKEYFRQFVVSEISVYFDEWLHQLTPLKNQFQPFLTEFQKMLLDFTRTYGPVNEIIKAAWGDHINEFLSEPAKKFLILFKDVAAPLDANRSFDIYRVVITFCRYFHVKLNLEDCFSASTILMWFNKLCDSHKEWITKIVSTDDFASVAEGVHFSCGFRDFRDLLYDRLCSIYSSILVKPPIITNKFVETLCICCLYFCKEIQANLIREKFFAKLDVAVMSVRFAMALNGVSECYELLLRETVRIKEQGQGESGMQGLPVIGTSSIISTKTNLECKIREIIEGFLTRVAISLRQLMQQIANCTAAQEIESHAMILNEFMNKLLSGLCQNINRMLFSIVLETLFRCCVEVLGSIAGEHQPWSPWQPRRDPKALVECARLIRESFCGSSGGLPAEKVNTPEFLWLESKLQSLTHIV
ncbi:uncharacterized protein LOC111245808 isoform X4 [Varroa destructor]|uniref:MHD2 domain-containing protein n=1 Tax=Varroa destructor TaxID=109461 RepID=A0A7M7JDS0_VARDE|nr:uncharacterized protein LOC111245808 isoform X4 [Varroa destructor]